MYVPGILAHGDMVPVPTVVLQMKIIECHHSMRVDEGRRGLLAINMQI